MVSNNLYIKYKHDLIIFMSAELKKEPDSTENHYYSKEEFNQKKVNLNDLVQRLNYQKKKDRQSNIILSAAAISAIAVFGIILTL